MDARRRNVAKPAAEASPKMMEECLRTCLRHREKSLKIDCEAVNCKHNEDHRCTAGHVGITGDGASEAEQTECATFEMR